MVGVPVATHLLDDKTRVYRTVIMNPIELLKIMVLYAWLANHLHPCFSSGCYALRAGSGALSAFHLVMIELITNAITLVAATATDTV